MANDDLKPKGLDTQKLEPLDRLKYKGIVVAVGGPPHSGKSVFLSDLYRQMLQHGSETFLQRACPDGEGMWSAESDPALVKEIRRKGKFSGEFMNFVRNSIAGLSKSKSRVLLDLGGVRSAENAEILERSTHLIIVCNEKKPEETDAWIRFAEKEGCIPIVVMSSGLLKNDDGTVRHGVTSTAPDYNTRPLRGALMQLDRDLPDEEKARAFGGTIKGISDWLVEFQGEYSTETKETRALVDALKDTDTTEAIESLPLQYRHLVYRAYLFAQKSFGGAKRMDIDLQIHHAARVMELASAEALRLGIDEGERAQLMVAALLHDVLEDVQSVSDQELHARFGVRVVELVRAVTRDTLPDGSVNEGEPDEAYLGRVNAGGLLAILLKAMDTVDNVSRLHTTPDAFRAGHVAATRESLPLWEHMHPGMAAQISGAADRASEVRDDTYYTYGALRNIAATSRTIQGKGVDTSASTGKQDMIVVASAEAAQSVSERNVKAALDFAFRKENESFSTADEVQTFVRSVAEIIQKDIVVGGKMFREDDSEKYPYTPIEHREREFKTFCSDLQHKLTDGTKPEKLAAWIEYRVDLTDHFFSDGCGKIAKVLSAWALKRAQHAMPQFRTRDELYAQAPKKRRALVGASAEDMQAEKEQWNAWRRYYKSLFTT